jgi:O-antigen/teichoic acid export membrane protein
MKKLASKFAEKLTDKGDFGFLLRGSSVVLLIQVFGRAIGYFDQVILARWMGATEYGTYIYILSLATLATTPPQLGQRGAVVRFIPEYKVKEEPGRLKGVVQGGLGLVLFNTVLVSLLGTAIAYFLSLRGQINDLVPVMVGIWMMPLIALTEVCMSILQGFRKMAASIAPLILIRPALILLGVSGIYFFRENNQALDSKTVLIVTFFVFLIILLCLLWMIRGEVIKAAGDSKAIYEFKKVLRVSLPLLLAAGFTNILVQSDIVMIGMIRGPEDVGLYNAAVRTSAIIGFILTSVSSAAAPMISATHAEGDSAKLQKIMRQINRMVMAPSLIIVVGVVALSGPLLKNFGPEFVAMQPVLIVLAIGQFIKASCGPIGFLLDLTGFQDDSARIRGLTASLNIGLNVVGIYILGPLGAALATVTSIVEKKVYTDYIVAKRVGISSSWLSLLRKKASASN